MLDWTNLYSAWRKAARGKRSGSAAAGFEHQLGDRLIALQEALHSESYRPGDYTSFFIHEPKRRLISAAPFRDRVVHHALCNIIEPPFERRFITDSFANRRGKGTHRAIDRLQAFSQTYRYVLRMDVVQHFPSIDHAILRDILFGVVRDGQIRTLIDLILASGADVLVDEYNQVWFEGDDLLAACRPRGLPIGNLTSQFWSNCYLNPFDHFVKRQLRCPAYLRYVDDFALFADDKRQLWDWGAACRERMARLRLTCHPAQVRPCADGIPWLGFVVYPTHRRIKRRKVVNARRHLRDRYADWRAGRISFAELDASVQGWINHVRHADSWGLRCAVLSRLARN